MGESNLSGCIMKGICHEYFNYSIPLFKKDYSDCRPKNRKIELVKLYCPNIQLKGHLKKNVTVALIIGLMLTRLLIGKS